MVEWFDRGGNDMKTVVNTGQRPMLHLKFQVS